MCREARRPTSLSQGPHLRHRGRETLGESGCSEAERVADGARSVVAVVLVVIVSLTPDVNVYSSIAFVS